MKIGEIGFYQVYLSIMKSWTNLLLVIFFIVGCIVLSLNVQLYELCKQQKEELNSIKSKQDVEAEFNTNKFKEQDDKIDKLTQGLQDSKDQMKDQEDALGQQKESLLQEVEKRQEAENLNKGVQASVVDVKAEADAIKDDMKTWQKDYVGVLASLEKKIDYSQDEMKSLEDNLNSLNIPELKADIVSLQASIEKISSAPVLAPEKKIERTHFESP